MSAPIVSIIVPFFNAAPYFQEFLTSVFNQRFTDFELLLGDDGSTDGSADMAGEAAGDPRVRVFNSAANRGVHATTCDLLCEAKGLYWCSPGADDTLRASFLESRLRFFQSNPGAAVVHGPGQWIGSSGEELKNNVTNIYLPELWRRMPSILERHCLTRVLLQHNVINMPSALIDMSATRKILPLFGPRWRWALDWALWILLAGTDRPFLWHNEVLHSYRVHSTSNTHGKDKGGLRSTERKLAPSHALMQASTLSEESRFEWLRWRQTLYNWSLPTILRHFRSSGINISTLDEAFTGQSRPPVSMLASVFLAAIPSARIAMEEKRARAGQFMPVGGCALIDDPLFSN
jgi:glycosyltransferase involved in cell wall biosynthesis